MSIDKVLAARLNAAMEIGELIGQTKAFTRIAGRCTAAKAQALATIHDEKQYRKLGMDWEAFCQNKVGINRRLADQIIREFKEFGPRYFDLAQVTPISAAQYRLIAPSVGEQGLTWAGETIAFTEKNAPRLAAAVAELRKAAEPPAEKAPPSADTETWKMVLQAEHALAGAWEDSAKLQRRAMSRDTRTRFIRSLNDAIVKLTDVLRDIM
jgi:hypothetical protein